MPRAVSALDSLGRADWPWIVFDYGGQAQARGATRLDAIRRAERAEGWTNHRKFLVAVNRATRERWVRLNGSWSSSKDKAA